MPEHSLAPRVLAIGVRAAQALAAARGPLGTVPGFAGTSYRLAAGELIWIGAAGPMHPRAVLVAGDTGDGMPAAALPAPWTPPARGAVDAAAAMAAMRRLVPRLAPRAPRTGFAPLLRGEMPGFPLRARAAEMRALCESVLRQDADGFSRAGARLVGIGAGLTPSGDDFVGGALFTLRFLLPAEAGWALAAARLVAAARARSHAVGAPLFADLAAGSSFAALHELCGAAARSATDAALESRADAVAAIGHSSGWDMLAGVFAATAALPSLP